MNLGFRSPVSRRARRNFEFVKFFNLGNSHTSGLAWIGFNVKLWWFYYFDILILAK